MLCVTKSQIVECFEFLGLPERNNGLFICTYFGNLTGSSSLEHFCGQTPQARKKPRVGHVGYANERAK